MSDQVFVVRKHPTVGYVVVEAEPSTGEMHTFKTRLPVVEDEAFASVGRAVAMTLQAHPGASVDIDPLCEADELKYRQEVAEYSGMLNDAREWFDRRAARLTQGDAMELGGILFPERVSAAMAAYMGEEEDVPVKIEVTQDLIRIKGRAIVHSLKQN